MILNLRVAQDGTVRAVGRVPDRHMLTPRFIQRNIGAGVVDVTVTLHLADGPVRYRLEGFTVNDDGTLNHSEWQLSRIDQPAPAEGVGGG